MSSLNSTSYIRSLLEYETNEHASSKDPHNKEKRLNAYYSLAKLCGLSGTTTHDFIFNYIKAKMPGNTDVTSLYREYRDLCFDQRSLNSSYASDVEKISKELGQYTQTAASAAHLFRNQSLNRKEINYKPNDELGLIPFFKFRSIAKDAGATDPTILSRSTSRPTSLTPTEFTRTISLSSTTSGSSSSRTTPSPTPSSMSLTSPTPNSYDLTVSFAELHHISPFRPISPSAASTSSVNVIKPTPSPKKVFKQRSPFKIPKTPTKSNPSR